MNSATVSVFCNLFRHWQSLYVTTKFEFKKKYAGSFLGIAWVILYPLLFLSVYLFLYLAVFKMSYPELNRLETIIYIFCGLVPYIAFMEGINGGAVVLKQNIHLIKNIILPIELVPSRIVLMSMITQLAGLIMILILAIFSHALTVKLLLLPVALLIEFFFILGIALMVAPLGLIVPDMGYFISLFTLLLLFVSPIGFVTTMLSGKLKLMVLGNPIYYLIEPFRMVFLPNEPINWGILAISAAFALIFFMVGAKVFSKFKEFAAEYE